MNASNCCASVMGAPGPLGAYATPELLLKAKLLHTYPLHYLCDPMVERAPILHQIEQAREAIAHSGHRGHHQQREHQFFAHRFLFEWNPEASAHSFSRAAGARFC